MNTASPPRNAEERAVLQRLVTLGGSATVRQLLPQCGVITQAMVYGKSRILNQAKRRGYATQELANPGGGDAGSRRWLVTDAGRAVLDLEPTEPSFIDRARDTLTDAQTELRAMKRDLSGETYDPDRPKVATDQYARVLRALGQAIADVATAATVAGAMNHRQDVVNMVELAVENSLAGAQ